MKMTNEYEKYLHKNVNIIKSHFRYESFKYYEGSRSYTGGKLICIHCGSEFTWKDWGRGKSRALTLSMKHLSNKHNMPYFIFSPSILRNYNAFCLAFPEAK